jgi:hypothetical protein
MAGARASGADRAKAAQASMTVFIIRVLFQSAEMGGCRARQVLGEAVIGGALASIGGHRSPTQGVTSRRTAMLIR